MIDVSPYLVAIVLAWIVAQGSKLLINRARNSGSIDYRQLYKSGSMPSSHSASVIALMSIIGLKDGIDSALFGLVTLFAAIVMYDAFMVRRSTGEQGEAIQALIKEQKSKVHLPRAAKGHEPLEVAAGALVGLVVGLSVFLIIK